VERTAEHVVSGTLAGMECVRVNIMWKVRHSRWTVVLLLQWGVLSEHYMEVTSQQVGSGIAA